MNRLYRCLAFGLVIFGMMIQTPRAQGISTPIPEAELKAAYLINLCKLTEWPEERNNRELTFGVWRSPAVLATLKGLAPQKINGRNWRVVELQKTDDLATCDAVFFGGPLNSELKTWLAAARLRPILTMGEAPGFGRAGGAVEFFTLERKLRFLVNLAAVRDSKAQISPSVLRLATTVLPGDKP